MFTAMIPLVYTCLSLACANIEQFLQYVFSIYVWLKQQRYIYRFRLCNVAIVCLPKTYDAYDAK